MQTTRRPPVIQVTRTQFERFKQDCEQRRSTGRFETTTELNARSGTAMFDAFRYGYLGSENRLVVFSGAQGAPDQPCRISVRIEFGISRPDPFDHTFLMILSRVFPEKDIEPFSLPISLHIFPHVEFDELRTRIISVSNAFSYSSYVQDPIISGCTQLAEFLCTRETPLDRIPDEAFEGQQVRNAIEYLKTYAPITGIRDAIADLDVELHS